MGLMRKAVSITTAGVVPFHNKDERSIRYQKQTRNAARAQVVQQGVALDLQRQQLAALDHANVREEMRPQTAPAAWYPDPGNPAYIRWFDGAQWTQHTQLANTPPPPPQ